MAPLIVSFLKARGQSDIDNFKLDMEEHTSGEHDWMWGVSDRIIYRVLDRLVSEGTIVATEDKWGRHYKLAAPPEKLLKIV